MNTHSLFSWLRHSPIPRRTVATLATLAVMMWSSIAVCGSIHDAARVGDLEKIKALLKDKPDLVSSKDDNGETPLHYAASRPKRKDVAELLLTNKADVNAKNNKGQMPLHIAAFRGIEDVAELLLANKADVHAKDNNGETPLHYAASRPNGWNGSYTEEHIGVMEFLLANKADVNAKDNNGETPLHIAVANGRGDSAEWLRLHGGQDETGRKPLANLKGLAGFKLPNGTLLITSGFPYDKEQEISNGYTISVGNSGDVEKLLFDKVLVQEQLSPDGKLVSRLANSVVGISWRFNNARTSFRVGNYVYTALRAGSTVTFTKEGVVMAGFQITPFSDYKKR